MSRRGCVGCPTSCDLGIDLDSGVRRYQLFGQFDPLVDRYAGGPPEKRHVRRDPNGVRGWGHLPLAYNGIMFHAGAHPSC